MHLGGQTGCVNNCQSDGWPAACTALAADTHCTKLWVSDTRLLFLDAIASQDSVMSVSEWVSQSAICEMTDGFSSSENSFAIISDYSIVVKCLLLFQIIVV